MDLKPVINNPYLGYKLDPGEPGLLNKAKASESTLRVTAQEQRNLNRLVSEAVQEGRTVIWKGITYRPAIAGSFMGTAAGHTTVISVESPENETALSSSDYENGIEITPAAEGAEDQGAKGENGISNSSIAIDPQLAEESPDELSQQAVLLQASIGRLESQIQEADNGTSKEENGLEADQADQKKQHLSRKIQEKEDELNKIAMARLIKMQSELMAAMNQGFIQNSMAPAAMIKTAYGAGSQSPSQGGFEKIV
jgi:hypothetical protein